MKFKLTLFGAALFFMAMVLLAPHLALSQEEIQCEQDVMVQGDDTLWTLAARFFGDVLAFPAIVEATNAKAARDDSYASLEYPVVLEEGWKLCIPTVEQAEAILAESGTLETAIETVGPEFDLVGFPEGYQEEFELFYEFDRPDNKTARVIYANEAAASITQEAFEAAPVEPGEPFPYGSILVMDVYRTQQDDEGNVLLDENGRYLRGELFGLFVMRKEPGFGVKYGQQRNGEWEYAAYRPDGTFLVPPQNTTGCAACHVEAGQGRDWVFGAHRFFAQQAAQTGEAESVQMDADLGENVINIVDYTFQSAILTVEVGTEVTWVNNDVLIHTVTANDLSFNSGALRPNGSFSYTFDTPGEYDYFCAIHSSMKGKIIVTK